MPNLDAIDQINQDLDRLEQSRPAATDAQEVDVSQQYAGKIVLVTGANRGLGLGLVEHFLKRGATVVGGCRTPDKADALKSLLQMNEDSFMVQLDLGSAESAIAAAAQVEARLGVIDILLNNAGITSPNHPNDPILEASPEVITNVFQTNVIGTLSVTNAFLSLLSKSETKTVITMSSQLASIECCFGIQGRYGGVASYRIARAASNMAMRTFAGELRDQGFTFVSMSPGHVATDMGSAGGRKPPLTVDQSVNGMLNVIANLTPEDNGTFRQYDGATLPW